jgi:hypothetical protein
MSSSINPMPKDISTTTGTLKTERHCTRVDILLPVGQPLTVVGHFELVVRTLEGVVLTREPDGAQVLTQEQCVALPAYADAYFQLGTLLHAQRDLQEQ